MDSGSRASILLQSGSTGGIAFHGRENSGVYLQQRAALTNAPHGAEFIQGRCRRKIEMSPGVQSRDDTRVPDGHEERDLDCISAGELSSAFGLPRWIGIELLCR